ncbi:hypothetical protein [Microbacterium aurum]
MERERGRRQVRDVVKEFLKRYATEEKRSRWEVHGEIDRATTLAAGEAGMISDRPCRRSSAAPGCCSVTRFRAIVLEETIGAGQGSLAGALHFRTTSPCRTSCTWARRSRRRKKPGRPEWRPARSSGALATTEPGAGSYFRGIKGSVPAKKVDGGYLVMRAKTFVSSGSPTRPTRS